MNEMLDLIRTRRSVRDYDTRTVEEEKVRAVLEAGLLAPSAHDSRPWHFAVVSTPEGKEHLLSGLAAPFRRDMEAAGLPPETVAERLARSQRIFRAAPVLIVAFAPVKLPHNPLDRTGGLEEVLEIQSGALACGQMLLAAHSLGLGMCWFAAPLFCPDEVCGACGMDSARWRPRCLLTLGYPAPGSTPKNKPPVRPEDYLTFL